ncbi:MAG: hypothetical protein A2008_12365 [Candidatus Wallbacteria bacterium GWC2_49_35]|uniref:Uncharacterized protein n=1 Tax=Candidatus Wallbacteria bacterium GWC2_49_35 TaxID=1817813 RepID=A0A1F7WZX0_9BACT|nr:MAG: hypothetical protein A2008_12365 [Candidatus Wallbacteria bacterium GWC2_49_35]
MPEGEKTMTYAEVLAKLLALNAEGKAIIEGGAEMADAIKAEFKIKNDEAAKNRVERNKSAELLKKMTEALNIQDGDNVDEKLAEIQTLKEGLKPGAKNEYQTKYEALEKKFETKIKALEAANQETENKRIAEHQKRVHETKVNKALAVLQGTHHPNEMVALVLPNIVMNDDETFVYKSGDKETSVEDGIKDWLKLHPEYVKNVQNSGSGGSGSGGGSSTENPWSAKTLNLTQQMKITRENPTLAKQLEAAALKESKK